MRLNFSIRAKLLLVSLLLLLIPWMSYLYVRDMKAFLLSGQESALELIAKAVATVLHDRPELFVDDDIGLEDESDTQTSGNQKDSALSKLEDSHSFASDDEQTLDEQDAGNEISASPLANYINLDGDLSDWGELAKTTNVVTQHNVEVPNDFSVRHQLGYHGRFIYALFEVEDETVIHRSTGILRVDAADHIRITLQDPGRAPRRFTLIAKDSGRMSIYLMDEEWRYPVTGQPNYDLAADLRTTEKGYNVELRIPRFLLSSDTRIKMYVADVDDPDTLEVDTLLPITPQSEDDDTTRVLVESVEITKILSALDRDDTRIWVLNHQQRIKAVIGNITTGSFNFHKDRPKLGQDKVANALALAKYYYDASMAYIFNFVIKNPGGELTRSEDSSDQFNDEIIQRALEGEKIIHRQPSFEYQGDIIIATHPVFLGDDILGAVIVEQSTNQLLFQQQRLLENVISVTLLVFLTVVAAILFFASRLTVRIRRLRNATDNAIDRDGKIITAKLPAEAKSRDEIGDLSRSVSTMLGRLSQYTSYLRGLPDTLAHEVSNPLNVVNSSLHNLSQSNPSVAESKYLERARNGVNRIGSILHNLTEAASLEKALQNESREIFDVATLIEQYVDGYSISHPNQKFEIVIHNRPLMVKAAPDYIAQVLDKLVDNAIDFAAPETPILFKAQQLNEFIQIDVVNFGSTLPDDMSERIFEPLVSLGRKDAQKSRLGMGLYVVKLIASFHGGDVIARNLSSADGVIFSFTLPNYNIEH